MPEQPDVDARVERALDRLDFTQRVGQLNQRLLGWRAVERWKDGFRLSDEGRREVDRWGGLGALYGLFRADAWSGRTWQNGIRPEERAEVAALVQDEVRRASGIGVLLSEEAPHGHQALGGSIMPVPLAAAASFDRDLVRESSAAVAAQLRASGVHLALVSTLDLLRDPRWGRSEECFGEDPYLASVMTRAVVEGMQGTDRAEVGRTGVAVVLKHLAAQGEAMGGRNGQSSLIGERDLAELHLPMVEAGVRAGALGFMAAYNDIDGVPCCANRDLLHDLLRSRWGFDGIVMADGLAVDRLEALTGSIRESGRLALLSGVDLSLWDEGFATLDQLSDDPVVRAAVDVACRRVLTLKARFGLLSEEEEPEPVVDLRESITLGDDLSQRVAAASLVLLERGSLPWTGDALRNIVVAGPYADDHTALLGDYVAPLEVPAPGIASALQRALPDASVRVAVDADAAIDLADGADALVLVLGGTSHRAYGDDFAANGALQSVAAATSGEGVDLSDLDLPPAQRALIRRVSESVTVPVAAVVVSGRPHVLTPLVDAGMAIVWAGFPGPHGGAAVADVLLGKSSPTGRLPFTAPRSSGVVPLHHNDRHDAASVYRDQMEPVLFPFGSGRGFLDPDVNSLTVTPEDEGVRVTVDVHSPHDSATTAVHPVFIRRWGGTVLPRRQELVGVLRAVLAPGEHLALDLTLPADAVRAVDAKRPWLRVIVAAHEADLRLPLLEEVETSTS
ncbi:glycoside hydrolase family 3 protein [Microbacterium murale]|uniref:Beta-glucosidase n=1 Tax=Microbacterium murale TaxID=1081040 RepID=A0ABU0P8Y3_9MICO|nr:glycoside hydrolase family 3 N-terminal domain-containing protein [Microbacterium murale]MDQ0643790.1 beta-glucosidase [Microbacterium murale]